MQPPKPVKWMLTDKEKQDRLNTCKTCPMYKPLLVQCGACRCFLKVKAAFKATRCPLGKWKV